MAAKVVGVISVPEDPAVAIAAVVAANAANPIAVDVLHVGVLKLSAIGGSALDL